MIYKDNRAHEQEAVHPGIFRVYRLFYFTGIGGVERGESTISGRIYTNHSMR